MDIPIQEAEKLEKVDYKQEMKGLYEATEENVLIEVPGMNFIMIDGDGNPDTSAVFQQSADALQAVSYTLKSKSRNVGKDYDIMPLETLWYMGNIRNFSRFRKDNWKWTLMIMQPDHISANMMKKAVAEVAAKHELPLLDSLRYERFNEGLSAQVLYKGSYHEEHETIMKLHDFIKAEGYEPVGKHHEIYLNNPDNTDPEDLKTIIRQPVALHPAASGYNV